MASKASLQALPTLFSAGPSTMTAFLYQTRTLSSLQRTGRRSILRSQLEETTRQFSSSIAREVVQANRDETTTTVSAVQEERKGPTISRTTLMRVPGSHLSGGYYGENGSPRSEAGNPQEESSIMRKVFLPEATYRQADMWWANSTKTKMDENDFDDVESSDLYETGVDFFDDKDEIDTWTRQSEPSHARQTTITPSERAAFETIFDNIRNQMKNAQRYGVVDDMERKTSPAARQRAAAQLEGILGDAMSTLAPRTRQEMEVIVNRYPASLRALAAKAVGLDFDESDFEKTAKEEQMMNNDQLKQLRNPIREGVEAKMSAAETDIELWAVMEEEVFPLIERLGFEAASKQEGPRKKRGKKTKMPTKGSPEKLVLPSEGEQTSRFEPMTRYGQFVSPLALYGPLYPSYLLLGFRLLDRSFARPSPLTDSVLPKIKSLGLISHVLGASTQLYNELLIIYWYRYNNFDGTLNLLSEMEQSGLSFNRETLEIVEDIIKTQGRMKRGDRGPTLQMLWSMPEFGPGKFRQWQKKITMMLDEEDKIRGD